MSKEFDPDKPFVKIRGMGQVHYEQDGCKFNSGYKFVEKLNSKEPAKPAASPPPAKKKQSDVRKRAAAKIAGKKGGDDDGLEGFRNKETPDAVTGAVKENAAAKAAEEHA